MKRSLLASAAAVLVSSALLASPAAAADATTSESVLPTTYQSQPVTKTSSGGMTTMGVGSGSKTYWCAYWGWFC
jgi:hypothetical protein